MEFAPFGSDAFKAILEAKPTNVNLNQVGKDERGNTLLMQALDKHRVDLLKPLVEAGADVNFISERGWTPLSSAAFITNIDAIKELLSLDADINFVDGARKSALTAAIETYVSCTDDEHGCSDFNAIEFLISKGALICKKDLELASDSSKLSAYSSKLSAYLQEQYQLQQAKLQ